MALRQVCKVLLGHPAVSGQVLRAAPVAVNHVKNCKLSFQLVFGADMSNFPIFWTLKKTPALLKIQIKDRRIFESKSNRFSLI